MRPHDDRLPVRTQYGSEGLNIALPIIESGPECYWTLMDVLASFLLTGHATRVLQSLEFVPHGSCAHETKAIPFFGEENYTINPATDDIFARMIDLRTQVRRSMKEHEAQGEDISQLDGIQEVLKLLANATSYGVYVEMNEGDERKEGQPVIVCDSATSFLRSLVSCECPSPQREPFDEGDLFDGVKGFGDLIPQRRLVEELSTALHWRPAE